MRPHVLGLVVGVAPPELGIVLWISGHAEEIQAVQLVEDFEADTVTCFACFGVRDSHCVGGFLELGEVFLGYHLVGYWMSRGQSNWVSGVR